MNKLAKRFLIISGAVTLAAILAAAIAPKAAHALAAALVQVTNTAANPVPILDVNTPAEEPFQTQLCSGFGQFGNQCIAPLFFVVPSTTTDGASVKRLVIEDFSGICTTSPTSGNTFVEGISVQTSVNENAVNSVSSITVFAPVAPPPQPAISRDQIFSQPVRLYADTGSNVELQPSAVGTDVVGADVICVATVNGYLVTK